jgi:hypothetical protein
LRRNGAFTIKSCPGKKTEVSMKIRGFNIKNLDDRKRKILEVFRQAVLRDYSKFLNLPRDQIVVSFKAGSVIVIGAIVADNMPDAFDPGNGQDMLAELKAIPGVEDLVEEGLQLEDCDVDPEPDFPVDDEADAVGDPHMTLATGGTVDMCCEDGHCEPCSQ